MRRALGLAGLVAAAGLATALAGCGFTPMYAEPGVGNGLQHIEVVAPRGRLGYLLGQSLDDDFGNAKGQKPLYRLQMEASVGRQAHGLNSSDVAQRYEFDLRVTYTLTDISTGKTVHTGTVLSNISYDSADQPYAGIAASEDVQNRLASDAAQKVWVQIAAWMANQHAS